MYDKTFYYWYNKVVLMSKECAEFVILLQGLSNCEKLREHENA
jgi:hypothetical protein